MSKKRILGVIPARYSSTRLPGKPLADICGKPMIVRVWERVVCSTVIDQVIVATDDCRIMEVCERFSVPAIMTSSDLASGSDRVYEALDDEVYDIAVNIQGDEPLIDPEELTALVKPLLKRTERCAVSSLISPLVSIADFKNPNIVKTVMGIDNRALYFSRSPIPYSADGLPANVYRHIGLYAFTQMALERFISLQPGELEKQERLEQLRLLEAGVPIYLSEVKAHNGGVDTADDLERVRKLFQEL